MSRCISSRENDCQGEVFEYTSRSGASTSFRCDKHQADYEKRMDVVYADVSSRYPGWDTPGSQPPSWFDPTYAGESWDED